MTRRTPRRRATRPGVESMEGRCLMAATPIGVAGAAEVSALPVAGLVTQQFTGPVTPLVGSPLLITITVTNFGPQTAPNVQLVDHLPQGAAFVSAGVVGGGNVSGSDGTVVFNLGDLAAGQKATALLVVKPTRLGTLLNAIGAAANVVNPQPVRALSALSIPVFSSHPVPFRTPTAFAPLRFGSGNFPTQITLSFTKPLDPISAQNPANYLVFVVQPDPVIGDVVDVAVPVASVNYRARTQAVVIRLAKHIPLKTQFLLDVNGQPPSGVRTASGALIDGDEDGQPGGDFITTVGPVYARGNLPRGFPAIPFPGPRPPYLHKIRGTP